MGINGTVSKVLRVLRLSSEEEQSIDTLLFSRRVGGIAKRNHDRDVRKLKSLRL